MATITYTCKVCSVVSQEEEDDFRTDGSGDHDPDVPGSIDLAAIGLGNALGPNQDTVCGDCRKGLERRFSRPAHSLGVRTLGDVIEDAFVSHINSLGKGSESEAHAQSMRDYELAKVALARVGKDICVTVADWVDHEDGDDGCFLLAGEATNKPGEYGYGQADWFAVAHRLADGGCVNAHDYLPDGTVRQVAIPSFN